MNPTLETTAADASSNWTRFLCSPILLAVVSLSIHWAGNARTGLWDRDEPRFATAAREMTARGDWIVPTFNGELRPDKPIFAYWLMKSAYAVVGDGTFGARLFSGLAGTAACLLAYALGRSMFGAPIGVAAGWMAATAPMLIAESKLATVDALLLLFTATALAAGWRVYADGPKVGWSYPVLFWASLALAVLTKGPVAVAFVALTLLGFCAARREFTWLASFRPLAGGLLFVALVAPWCVAVQQ
ncbi:MAG: ArnT family glycosyltransferase, partial [Planctomycetia bacterium]